VRARLQTLHALQPESCTGSTAHFGRRIFGRLLPNAQQYHGGAEVECSLLFADVRGSTTLAESTSPRGFNRMMGRFYDTTPAVLVDHDEPRTAIRWTRSCQSR
jgi:class 3 adenylate cyclase